MTNKEQARENIKKLVESFRANAYEKMKVSYDETQVRREFIDPLFEILGWDVGNKANKKQSQKDVVLEYKQRIVARDGSYSNKRPDYAFRVNGKIKFFVEAKAPHVDLTNAETAIFQIRNYGYHKRLAISVLTDFQELYIYDTKISLKKNIKPLKAFKYEEYINRFDELWDSLSYEAIENKYSQFSRWNDGISKETEKYTINSDFLAYLNEFREELARNIAKNNKDNGKIAYSEYDLNYIVQKIIDRVIFLRIAEARGLEYGDTLKNFANSSNAYESLNKHFEICQKRYNSDLFPSKDPKLTEDKALFTNLIIDNSIFKIYISKKLYDECDWLFEIIPVEVLGSIYEHFLGKSIYVTDQRIKIEDKPEVKKAKGIYYTPQYIVDYIVKNTIGKQLAHQDCRAVDLTVLDSACGSGAFLLGAYEYLLSWYLEQYTLNDTRKKASLKDKKIYAKKNTSDEVEYFLHISERKRILVEHIYGVDIDHQAVEMAKLSLILKMMENASADNDLYHVTEKETLPDLSEYNIKCGNSLLGTDVLDEELEFTREDKRKLNLFDWKDEFKSVFAKGGFDCLIGNPPYVSIQNMTSYNPLMVQLLKENFKSAKVGNIDIYLCFVEQGLKLIKQNGLLGYILPHKFFEGDMGESLRKIVSDKKALKNVVYFGANQVFSTATTYTCLLFLSNEEQQNFGLIRYYEDAPLETTLNEKAYITLDEEIVTNKPWNFHAPNILSLLNKLHAMPVKLSDITRKIFQGIATSGDDIYVLQGGEDRDIITTYSKSLDREIEIERGFVKPFLMGKDIKRYSQPIANKWVIFPYKIENNKAILYTQKEIQTDFPLAWLYLKENKKALENRESGKMKHKDFYAYIYPKNLVEFDTPKISLPYMANQNQATFDNNNNYHTTKVYSLSFKNDSYLPLYILGILNSPLFFSFVQNVGTVFRGWYYVFTPNFIGSFPIAEATSEQQQSLEKLVKERLQAQAEYDAYTNPTPTQLKDYHDDIKIIERKINKIVYALYNLTDDEIRIVEEG